MLARLRSPMFRLVDSKHHLPISLPEAARLGRSAGSEQFRQRRQWSYARARPLEELFVPREITGVTDATEQR